MRVLTKPLIAILTDLVLTSTLDPEAGAVGSVLVYTARGGWGDEPGEVDLLCGVSTDRFVIGATHTECFGQAPVPMLWPARDVKNVIAVFKAASKDDKHAVEIVLDGSQVIVREDHPNLFGDGLSLSFTQADFQAYPGTGVFRMLERQMQATVSPKMPGALPRTDCWADRLAPFVKVANRRHEPIRTYRDHQSLRVLVQVGPTYRGAFVTLGYEPAGLEDAPDAELPPPDLDRIAELCGIDRTHGDGDITKDGGEPAAAEDDDDQLEMGGGDAGEGPDGR